MICYSTEILFKTNEDRSTMEETMRIAMSAWNECSRLVFESKPELRIRQIHALCYDAVRKFVPDAPSQMVVKIERDVMSTFMTINSNKHNISKAPIKTHMSLRLDVNLYKFFSANKIKLTTFKKRIEVGIKTYPKLVELFSKYKAHDPLLYKKNGKMWLQFGFKLPEAQNILEPIAIGVDLGIRNLAVTSEGIIYRDSEYNKHKRELRFKKRNLQSKQTKSAKKHLKKLRHDEKNATKNMTHHLANAIIKDTKANVIAIENLKGMKVNTKKYRSFNNRHAQVPYFIIRQFLEYKAPLKGKRVVTVSPAFTSQTDFRTGKRDGSRFKGAYFGYDGKVLHADANAACNIAQRSKLPILYSNTAIYGQGLVNDPIACKSFRSSKVLQDSTPLG